MKPAKRRNASRGSGNNTVGIMVILVIVIGLAVYFGAAGVAGNWLAEHVVGPVLSKFGLWDSTALPEASIAPQTSPVASADPAATDASATEVQGITANVLGMNAYFLQTGAFELEGNAAAEAGTLVGRGGAGYVAADGGKFRVFLSTYDNRQDADNVRDKLTAEGVESRVHVLESPAKSIAVANDNQRAALESAVQKYTNAVACLNQASMHIDDAAKSQEQAAAAVAEFQAVRTELDTGFASGENAYADELYELAGTMANELGAGDGSQSAIQHAYTKATFEYAMLLNSI